MQIEGTLEKFSYTGGMHYLRIKRQDLLPHELAEKIGSARIVCVYPSGTRTHNALGKLPDGDGYVLVNASVRKEHQLRLGDPLRFELHEDPSKYGLPMPAVLEELLEQDAEAKQLFEALTDGKKRSVIQLVGSAKREQTQVDRTLRVVEHLKVGHTNPRDWTKPLDYI